VAQFIQIAFSTPSLGYPLVKGSGRFGSVSDLYIGAGDEVFFG